MNALTRRRDHLAKHRRWLLGRSIAITGARLVPVPGMDDWLATRLLAGTFTQLADEHQLVISDEAVVRLTTEISNTTSLSKTILAGAAVKLATRYWIRTLFAFTTVRRAQAAAQTFVRFTLFSHYCAKLHVGGDIDAHTADRLRTAMNEALDETKGSIAWLPFRRGVAAAVRATVRAPFELADLASRGWLSRITSGRVLEPAEESEIERAIDEAIAKETGFLGRAAASIETHLAAEYNPTLEAVIANFEDRWRHRLP